jgi:hypothetical protein
VNVNVLEPDLFAEVILRLLQVEAMSFRVAPRHLGNIFRTKELDLGSVVAVFATTAAAVSGFRGSAGDIGLPSHGLPHGLEPSFIPSTLKIRPREPNIKSQAWGGAVWL